jgi:hypothetical protein
MLQAGRSRVSIPDEVIEFFSIYLILSATLCPGVDSALNRNEYQTIFLSSKARPVSKADNITVICEQIV